MSNDLRAKLRKRRKTFRTAPLTLDDDIILNVREPSALELSRLGGSDIREKMEAFVGLLMNPSGTAPLCKNTEDREEYMDLLGFSDIYLLDDFITTAFSPKA